MLRRFFQISAERMGALKQLENDLVVVGEFMALTKSEEKGQNLKGEITHIKELCKHMDTEIIVSDLTGKKLFSFTDSTEVEA